MLPVAPARSMASQCAPRGPPLGAPTDRDIPALPRSAAPRGVAPAPACVLAVDGRVMGVTGRLGGVAGRPGAASAVVGRTGGCPPSVRPFDMPAALAVLARSASPRCGTPTTSWQVGHLAPGSGVRCLTVRTLCRVSWSRRSCSVRSALAVRSILPFSSDSRFTLALDSRRRPSSREILLTMMPAASSSASTVAKMSPLMVLRSLKCVAQMRLHTWERSCNIIPVAVTECIRISS
mmetsp:Transcript_27422/g.69084  ORF Transcript_27422/g.69084 Transcript_27422/m.69084 type:complete len:235 (-) Transcript_27422:147-851(-)